MKKITKKITLSILSVIIFMIISAIPVHAHCPLCTGAVAAGAVTAKYLGLDISIVGLLVGAFGISTGLWFGKKIKKEFFKFQLYAVAVLSFLLTVVPLRFISTDNIYLPLLLFGEPGSILNKIYWIDKLIFGSIIGGLLTFMGYWLHNYIKKVKGKVLFPYQGIAITVGLLFATGLIMFLII